MAKLDLNKLKKVNEDIANRSNNDGKMFLGVNKLGEETDWRILPATEKMEGLYFVEVIIYWINKKMFISPQTFDKPCPIAEEVEKAKALGDKDIDELLKDWKVFNKSSEFWVPGLQLECVFDEDTQECVSYKVVDDMPKILTADNRLIVKLNKAVSSRFVQNGTEDGIADRKEGFNLILSRTKVGKDVQYDAQPWRQPLEILEKYYRNVPDIFEVIRKKMKDDTFLRASIRNFIYGEPMPASANDNAPDVDNSEDASTVVKVQAKPEKATEQKQTPPAVTKPKSRAGLLAQMDDE